MKFKFSKAISLAVLFSIVGFMFLGSMQYYGKMERAAVMQVNVIDKTITAIKYAFIYPYLSAFIKVEDLGSFKNGRTGGREKLPVKNQNRNDGFLKHLYSILSTILYINKGAIIAVLVLFLIAHGFSAQFGINGIKEDRGEGIFLYDFLICILARDRFLKSLHNMYDTANLSGISMGKSPRSEKTISQRGFFLNKRMNKYKEPV